MVSSKNTENTFQCRLMYSSTCMLANLHFCLFLDIYSECCHCQRFSRTSSFWMSPCRILFDCITSGIRKDLITLRKDLLITLILKLSLKWLAINYETRIFSFCWNVQTSSGVIYPILNPKVLALADMS